MIERWVEGYLRAWATDAPDDIESLFTEDARYFTEPYAEPWEGRDAIVREWIERGDSGLEWTFEHEVVVESDGIAVIRGLTYYPGKDPDDPGQTYHNIWIIRTAPDGRANEFTEFWMKAK